MTKSNGNANNSFHFLFFAVLFLSSFKFGASALLPLEHRPEGWKATGTIDSDDYGFFPLSRSTSADNLMESLSPRNRRSSSSATSGTGGKEESICDEECQRINVTTGGNPRQMNRSHSPQTQTQPQPHPTSTSIKNKACQACCLLAPVAACQFCGPSTSIICCGVCCLQALALNVLQCLRK